jgi:uncharacterized membrane protein
MRLLSDKYPSIILLCLLWSIISFFFILLDIHYVIRIVLAIPLIIFIPGYILVYVLFPTKKTDKGIDTVERIALSFGLSIAVVPLIGVILNYTIWGITVNSIIVSLGVFIFIIGILAWYRWIRTSASTRYELKINMPLSKDETKLDKSLTAALIICIIVASSLLVFTILSPRQGERFTEFYVLGSNHLASDYPTNLSIDENATVVLGVINHEDAFRYYSIEVWLSNQTTSYNTTTRMNETTYHNLWFIDKIDLSLPSLPINLEELNASQWEYNYTFHINRSGTFKLVFLLYTSQVHHYSKDIDYKTNASEIVDEEHTTAYRNLHIWITVN